MSLKEELKCVIIKCGELSVTMAGILVMLMLFAISLVINLQVA